MSDVFVHNETRWEMPRIAFVLTRSGYSTAELDAIWDNEIVPECAWNLLQVEGEWKLFVVDEEALAARAEGYLGLHERTAGVALPLFLGAQWNAIKTMRAMLLSISSEESAHVRRTLMWTAFVRTYIAAPVGNDEAKTLSALGANTVSMAEAFEAVRPVLRSLLLGDEQADETRRANDVRELIARASRASDPGVP